MTKQMTFSNPSVLREMFGVQDAHLRRLESLLGIKVSARGTNVTLEGTDEHVARGEEILLRLYELLHNGRVYSDQEVRQTIQLLATDPQANIAAIFAEEIKVMGKRRKITPRSPGQQAYVQAIRAHDMVFGVGPAGTGKTYLAMAMAVESLLNHQHERIILCRPAVEAGEKLGFLPGSMQEKVNPYLRPLYDALHDMMDFEQAKRMLEDGTIEVAPLAFMRGRTLANSFVILDEGQNCTPEQMKMFLTRLGAESKAVITGDITQIDLPDAVASGMVEAIRILNDVEGIAVYYLSGRDVVRHVLVQSIIHAYEQRGGSGV